MKTLSFVVPCYRSEHTINQVAEQVEALMKEHPEYDYELIMVNDHSPDNVWDVITALSEKKAVCLDFFFLNKSKPF